MCVFFPFLISILYVNLRNALIKKKLKKLNIKKLESDNRQPFASDKFIEFASTYSFELVTSSLTYAQSNGKNVEEKLRLTKSKQSMYYNRGAKELDELHSGDRFRIQLQHSQLGKKKEWTPTKVERKVDIQSYQVQTEDG